jgi:hypothetical protein
LHFGFVAAGQRLQNARAAFGAAQTRKGRSVRYLVGL